METLSATVTTTILSSSTVSESLATVTATTVPSLSATSKSSLSLNGVSILSIDSISYYYHSWKEILPLPAIIPIFFYDINANNCYYSSLGIDVDDSISIYEVNLILILLGILFFFLITIRYLWILNKDTLVSLYNPTLSSFSSVTSINLIPSLMKKTQSFTLNQQNVSENIDFNLLKKNSLTFQSIECRQEQEIKQIKSDTSQINNNITITSGIQLGRISPSLEPNTRKGTKKMDKDAALAALVAQLVDSEAELQTKLAAVCSERDMLTQSLKTSQAEVTNIVATLLAAEKEMNSAIVAANNRTERALQSEKETALALATTNKKVTEVTSLVEMYKDELFSVRKEADVTRDELNTCRHELKIVKEELISSLEHIARLEKDRIELETSINSKLEETKRKHDDLLGTVMDVRKEAEIKSSTLQETLLKELTEVREQAEKEKEAASLILKETQTKAEEELEKEKENAKKLLKIVKEETELEIENLKSDFDQRIRAQIEKARQEVDELIRKSEHEKEELMLNMNNERILHEEKLKELISKHENYVLDLENKHKLELSDAINAHENTRNEGNVYRQKMEETMESLNVKCTTLEKELKDEKERVHALSLELQNTQSALDSAAAALTDERLINSGIDPIKGSATDWTEDSSAGEGGDTFDTDTLSSTPIFSQRKMVKAQDETLNSATSNTSESFKLNTLVSPSSSVRRVSSSFVIPGGLPSPGGVSYGATTAILTSPRMAATFAASTTATIARLQERLTETEKELNELKQKKVMEDEISKKNNMSVISVSEAVLSAEDNDVSLTIRNLTDELDRIRAEASKDKTMCEEATSRVRELQVELLLARAEAARLTTLLLKFKSSAEIDSTEIPKTPIPDNATNNEDDKNDLLSGLQASRNSLLDEIAQLSARRVASATEISQIANGMRALRRVVRTTHTSLSQVHTRAEALLNAISSRFDELENILSSKIKSLPNKARNNYKNNETIVEKSSSSIVLSFEPVFSAIKAMLVSHIRHLKTLRVDEVDFDAFDGGAIAFAALNEAEEREASLAISESDELASTVVDKWIHGNIWADVVPSLPKANGTLGVLGSVATEYILSPGEKWEADGTIKDPATFYKLQDDLKNSIVTETSKVEDTLYSNEHDNKTSSNVNDKSSTEDQYPFKQLKIANLISGTTRSQIESILSKSLMQRTNAVNTATKAANAATTAIACARALAAVATRYGAPMHELRTLLDAAIASGKVGTSISKVSQEENDEKIDLSDIVLDSQIQMQHIDKMRKDVKTCNDNISTSNEIIIAELSGRLVAAESRTNLLTKDMEELISRISKLSTATIEASAARDVAMNEVEHMKEALSAARKAIVLGEKSLAEAIERGSEATVKAATAAAITIREATSRAEASDAAAMRANSSISAMTLERDNAIARCLAAESERDALKESSTLREKALINDISSWQEATGTKSPSEAAFILAKAKTSTQETENRIIALNESLVAAEKLAKTEAFARAEAEARAAAAVATADAATATAGSLTGKLSELLDASKALRDARAEALAAAASAREELVKVQIHAQTEISNLQSQLDESRNFISTLREENKLQFVPSTLSKKDFINKPHAAPPTFAGISTRKAIPDNVFVTTQQLNVPPTRFQTNLSSNTPTPPSANLVDAVSAAVNAVLAMSSEEILGVEDKDNDKNVTDVNTVQPKTDGKDQSYKQSTSFSDTDVLPRLNFSNLVETSNIDKSNILEKSELSLEDELLAELRTFANGSTSSMNSHVTNTRHQLASVVSPSNITHTSTSILPLHDTKQPSLPNVKFSSTALSHDTTQNIIRSRITRPSSIKKR